MRNLLRTNRYLLLIAFFIALFAIQSALAGDDRVAVVGLDQIGRSHLELVPAESFRATLRAVSASIRDSVSAAIFRRNPAQLPGALELHTLAVGVSIKGEAGLGFLWKLAGKARMRFVFSNTNTPVYPD